MTRVEVRGCYVTFNGDVVDDHDEAAPRERWGVFQDRERCARYATRVFTDALEFGDPDKVGGVVMYGMRGDEPGKTDVPLGRVVRGEFVRFATWDEIG